MPNAVFVVDDDVRIVECNAAALKLADTTEIHQRGGEVLHCLRSTETPSGCGSSPACRECVIRNSVAQAFEGGGAQRRTHRMWLVRGDQKIETYVLVTSAPIDFGGRRLALLVLEDITELIALRGILPICAGCRKIRDDQNYWHNVESYFKRQLDIDFSHGLCPDCIQKMFPGLAGPPAAEM